MKKYIILSLLNFFSTVIIAQSQQEADSLKNALQTQQLSITDQMKILEKLYFLYKNQDWEEAIQYAEQGLALAKKEKDKSWIAGFYNNAANTYKDMNKLDTAYLYQKKAIELAVQINDKKLESNCYNGIAAIYQKDGKYQEALEYYQKSLTYYETKNRKQYMYTLANIGGIYRELENIQLSLQYTEKAQEIAQELNDTIGLMKTCLDIGAIYLISDAKKAEESFLQLLEISKKVQHNQFETAAVHGLSMLYYEENPLKDMQKAEQYALECLRLSKMRNDSYGQMMSWNSLSNIYREQRRWKECEEMALKCWVIDSTNITIASNTAANIAIANMYINNPDKGQAFLWKFNDIKNRYVDELFHEKIIDMEVRYETEKKEAHIASLEKEKTLFIWLGIAAVLLLLMTIGLLFYRQRLNTQNRKLTEQQIYQLEQEKQLIATQSELDGETAERIRLARDLHDELGGMLSIIRQNLGKIPNDSFPDKRDVMHFFNASDMLNKAIVEVRRIAHHMMPESLLQNGLKISLEDLCCAVEEANFQFYGDDTLLDDHLAIILYRCTYELVNNASKHANATTINVQLLIDKGLISLIVQDNGRGFDPETIKEGAGLNNIKRRISVYKGKMNIDSSSENGTEITIEIES